MISWKDVERSQETMKIEKERKRAIESPFLDNFLKAEAEAREKMIDETTRQLHLAKQYVRYSTMQKVCRNHNTYMLLERCKAETIKLMERC